MIQNFINFFKICLPVGKRRLYFITFQPYPKHKSYARCQNSCGPIMDFLKKFNAKYVIVREYCKSGKAHYHMIGFFLPGQIDDVKRCRFSSVHVKKCKTPLFKLKHPWDGRGEGLRESPEFMCKADEENSNIFLWSNVHIAKQATEAWKDSCANQRCINRTYEGHAWQEDLERMAEYICKDLPAVPKRYSDYYIQN